jgi:hypothetical protein
LGGFDLYDPSEDEWTTVEIAVEGGGEGPEKRSVASLQGVASGVEWEGKKVIALLALGEREGAPAELGHDGAGFVSCSAMMTRRRSIESSLILTLLLTVPR